MLADFADFTCQANCLIRPHHILACIDSPTQGGNVRALPATVLVVSLSVCIGRMRTVAFRSWSLVKAPARGQSSHSLCPRGPALRSSVVGTTSPRKDGRRGQSSSGVHELFWGCDVRFSQPLCAVQIGSIGAPTEGTACILSRLVTSVTPFAQILVMTRILLRDFQ